MPSMQKLKVSEGLQKPAPTLRGTRHFRNSSSDSDPLHHRPITERSPRLGDHSSPRGTQSDPPIRQKKLGTRITNLETQLVQAQNELKSLKNQLASAETQKKKAQEELRNKGTKKPGSTQKTVTQKKPNDVKVIQKPNLRNKSIDEAPEDVHWEADVFEVPVEKTLVEEKSLDGKLIDSSISEEKEHEKEKICDEKSSNSEEIDRMRAMLEEKEKAIETMSEENKTLKKLLEEANSEMASKVSQLGQDLEVSIAKEAKLKEKLSEIEVEKEELENEMKMMKVQTEQWRKAADAAASILASGVNTKGRIPERCASMDNHFNSIFEARPINGPNGLLGSPGEDHDESFGVEKKKSSGIRMLGDLLKKKGQK